MTKRVGTQENTPTGESLSTIQPENHLETFRALLGFQKAIGTEV